MAVKTEDLSFFGIGKLMVFRWPVIFTWHMTYLAFLCGNGTMNVFTLPHGCMAL